MRGRYALDTDTIMVCEWTSYDGIDEWEFGIELKGPSL